jgi:hypothetical protein
VVQAQQRGSIAAGVQVTITKLTGVGAAREHVGIQVGPQL